MYITEHEFNADRLCIDYDLVSGEHDRGCPGIDDSGVDECTDDHDLLCAQDRVCESVL